MHAECAPPAGTRWLEPQGEPHGFRNDSFGGADSGTAGCASNLAAQQAMGLLSERRHRLGVADNRDIAPDGQDLTRRSAAAQTAVPISAPMPAVTPMVKALQNVMRTTPLATFALPM